MIVNIIILIICFYFYWSRHTNTLNTSYLNPYNSKILQQGNWHHFINTFITRTWEPRIDLEKVWILICGKNQEKNCAKKNLVRIVNWDKRLLASPPIPLRQKNKEPKIKRLQFTRPRVRWLHNMCSIYLKKWGNNLVFGQWKHNLSAIGCPAATFIFYCDFFGNWVCSSFFLRVFWNANIRHENLTD